MTDKKTTRDIVLEMKGALDQYIKASTERREICGSRFDRMEDRILDCEKKTWINSGVVAVCVTAAKHMLFK